MMTDCAACGRLLSDHRHYTASDVAASHGATYTNPRNGYLAPMSPSVIGQWVSHTPSPWMPTLSPFTRRAIARKLPASDRTAGR